mmetsp:Transcript_9836/g.9673  ORF Transcript_9836/g.9673 Transcript_9836/m.9673 type:complete len:330 (-) Transcript_9836:71-1060(-)
MSNSQSLRKSHSRSECSSVSSIDIRRMAREELGYKSRFLQTPKSFELGTPVIKNCKRVASKFRNSCSVSKTRNRLAPIAHTVDIVLASPAINPDNGSLSETNLEHRLDRLWKMKVKKQNVLGMSSFSFTHSKVIRVRRRATLIKVHFLKKAFGALNNMRKITSRIRIFTNAFKFTGQKDVKSHHALSRTPVVMSKKPQILSSMPSQKNFIRKKGDFMVSPNNSATKPSQRSVAKLSSFGKHFIKNADKTKIKRSFALKKKITIWNSQKKYAVRMKAKVKKPIKSQVVSKDKYGLKDHVWTDKQNGVEFLILDDQIKTTRKRLNLKLGNY